MENLNLSNSITAFRSETEFSPTDFDNRIWRRTETAKINRYWSGAPAPAGRSAAARLVWTDKNLYVRFDCSQNEPYVLNETPNFADEAERLWERDVCEIFVAPNQNESERYFEFEIAPTGEWLDFAIRQLPDRRETDRSYDTGMKTSARREENSFTAIFAVNFERAFGKTPKRGEVWRANFFRCVGAGENRGYLAWQPTRTQIPNFHVPSAFGFLKFE